MKDTGADQDEQENTEFYASVVIPVYNESENLKPLYERLMKVMGDHGKPFEIIFVNDGSQDDSLELLRSFHQTSPREIVVVDLNGNHGQNMAVVAGFGHVRGEVIITLDADLQNPPEEIPKLLEKYEQGYDAVGSRRKDRQDTFLRRKASAMANRFREMMTDVRMNDQGCMLRVYSRAIVDAIGEGNERSTFVPALAYKLAANPTEIEVEHSERNAGDSKYNYYRLIRLNFDMITGITLLPLQIFTLLGFLASGGSLFLVFVLLFRRFISPGASEAEGVFTLFAILFLLVSVLIVQVGLVGEYVGRTYQSVQGQRRYRVRKLYRQDSGE